MKKIVVVVLSLLIFNVALADIELFNYINKQVKFQEEAQIIYDEIIKNAGEYSVDPRLIVSVIKNESNFKRVAESHKGAMGLMQVMPFHFNKSTENGKNISDNLRVGTKVLARCLNQSGGNIPIALAMYNAGEGAVKKYGGIPPYKETQGYVVKVLNTYNTNFNYNVSIPQLQLRKNEKNNFSIAWGESNFSIFTEENLDESK